jgi:hypothetical protein
MQSAANSSGGGMADWEVQELENIMTRIVGEDEDTASQVCIAYPLRAKHGCREES